MKIDITKLDGYKEGMTPEEQLALVQGYEVPDADYTGLVKKDLLDRALKEAGDAKKALREKQTEDERKEAERAAEQAAKDARLAELEKQVSISGHKAELMANGYEEKLAAESAEALASGDMKKFFENERKHVEAVKKAEKASALADIETPPAGQNAPPNKLADLQAERAKAIKEGRTVDAVSLQRKIRELPKEQ